MSACVALIARFDPGEDPTYLVVWNKKHRGWTLPGGALEEGEGIAACVRREVREETGLVPQDQIHVYTAPGLFRGSVYVFRVRAMGTPREAERGCPVTWMSEADILASAPGVVKDVLPGAWSEWYRRMFDDLRAGRSKPLAS